MLQSSYPEAYKWISDNIFPKLRRSDYVIDYTVRGYTDINEIGNIADNNPRKLSLYEIYKLVNMYPIGTDDFYRYIFLGVRMFPHNMLANLNAGAASIAKNEYSEALAYLSNSGNSSLANYNRGIYYALTEDYAEALNYFNQASDIEDTSSYIKLIERNLPEGEIGNSGRGYQNGHEWVDLGLPSGIKWATCNVGATSPEEIGDYFSWGEIAPKSIYKEDNYETYKKSGRWLKKNGYRDSEGHLTMEHDAARQNWGGTWRMPTYSEIWELISNTTQTKIYHNGVYLIKAKSKKNDNYILFPYTGFFSDNIVCCKDRGYYWSSDIFSGNSEGACALTFYSGSFSVDFRNRPGGLIVRGVTE